MDRGAPSAGLVAPLANMLMAAIAGGALTGDERSAASMPWPTKRSDWDGPHPRL